MTFFIAEKHTPILNQVDFSTVFGWALPFDDQNLVRALEMIAFPGTVFEIIQEFPGHIFEVRTAEYPTLRPLFIDSRFGKLSKRRPPEREKKCPKPDVILKRMENQLGKPYVWGGNCSAGISELMKYYPPQKKLTPLEAYTWTFQGVDCSGLLYEATEGSLPRNTQDLLFVGKGVPVSHLSWKELPKVLKPLDLIVWQGHMVIVCDKKSVIESKHEWGGVCLTDISKRLKYLREVEQKTPADDAIHVLQNPDTFLVRRFVS